MEPAPRVRRGEGRTGGLASASAWTQGAIRRAILPAERSAGAQEHRGAAQLLAGKAGSSSPSWGLRVEVLDPHSSLGCVGRRPFPWGHPGSGAPGDTAVPPPASKARGCLWGQATGQGADPQRPAVWLCPRCRARCQAAGGAQSATAPAAAPCEGSACCCLRLQSWSGLGRQKGLSQGLAGILGLVSRYIQRSEAEKQRHWDF